MTTARADRREPRLEHHPTIPKAPPVDLAPHPPPSWSSSRWGLIPWVVLGAQCPQREETRYWTPAVRRIRTTERIRTNEADAYAWCILRSSAVVAGVSRWRRRSPGAQSPTCASVRGHRRRKRFRTIVPTMETRSMSPTGTNTVTLSEPSTRASQERDRPRAWRGPAHPARGSPGRPQLRAESCPQSPRDEATGTTCLGKPPDARV